MNKLLTTALLLTIGLKSLMAQFYSNALPVDNVMSSYNLRCITQDQKGFLWMGSNSGLYRYDGYRYQKMKERQHPELQPDDAVSNIVGWGDKHLWISLRGELFSCYDIDRECFVDWSGNQTTLTPYSRYVIADHENLWLYDTRRGCRHVRVDREGNFSSKTYCVADKNLPSNHVNFIIQEQSGKAWIGTDQGLVSVNNGKSRVVIRGKVMVCAQKMNNGQIVFVSELGDIYQTHKSGSMGIFNPPSPLTHKVRRMACDDKQIILGTEGPTYCYNMATHTLAPHHTIHINNAQVVEDNHGNKVLFDYHGTDIWYFTPEQTIHFHDIYNETLTRQNSGGRFKFIYGSHGTIWISTYGNGLFAYNIKTGEMTHHTNTGEGDALVSSNYLLNVFEDQGGRIWICQESMGIRCIGNITQPLETRYFTIQSDQSHANTIRLIKPVGDRIFIGNRLNGLWTVDQQLEVADRTNPYGDEVVAATVDHQGRLWVGTRNRGIFIDGKPISPAIKGKVSDILCDRKGHVWITVFDGSVQMVTPQDDNTVTIRQFFQKEDAISQPRTMIEDHQGRIWLCSNKGISVFHPEQIIRDPKAYQHIKVSKDNDNADEIHCIFEDSKHRIWVGTTGYGLMLLDSNGTIIRQYTDKDGLPSNNIESIVEDLRGRLWIGTGYGLAKYIDSDDRFNTFFLSSTILGQMYTEGCATLLKDGRLAMGTLHGLQVFDPDDIKPRSSIFPLTITDICINGVFLNATEDFATLKEQFTQEHRLQLSHDQNSLTIYYSAFEYVANHIVKYAYMLEGVDNQWSEPSAQNFITYKNLRPGHYTLHVRTYNINGVKGEHEAVMDIIISQPWWNTWWAWIIYLLTALGVTTVVWRHYRQVNDLQNKIKVENQLTEYKLRFFTNISHEFRTPLTIIRGAMDNISAQGDIPGCLRQPISSMQKSTTRMLRLVNELLEFRKIQNEQLRLSLEETDIVGFLRNIFLTFHETAENRKISYLFTTPTREYKMFIDRNYVDKMAYNLLSNAFKYTTSKKSITLRIKLLDNNRLAFEVEDTGIGIPKEKQGNLFTRFDQSTFTRDSIGVGLHMVKELVRVHHGEIAFRENPEGGSIFCITLPTDKAEYQESDFLKESVLTSDQPTDKELQTPIVSYKAMQLPPLNNHLVLIVEDDDDMREHLVNELCRYFKTETALNGEEALQKMMEQRPALVVSDVRMPVMNGFKLTQKIRQDKELSDLPILLLTAISDEEKIVKGTEYGADAYMFKPFNAKVLVSKCRTLIEQRERLKVKYAKEVVGSAPIADIIIDDTDKKFLERFDAWIYGNMKKNDLQFMDFANSMKIGRTTFFKKVRQLTGMPPLEYIKKQKMTKAAEMLGDPVYSIAEVAYETGFDDPNYFSRTFKDYYGITASQFRKGEKPTK